LHVLGSAESGAAAHSRIVASLARSLDPDRYRIVAMFLGASGALREELRSEGVAVGRTPWSRGARDPIGAIRFARAIRAIRPAIVHHHVGGLALSELSRVTTGAVVLAHVHGARNETGTGNPALSIVRGADAIVATSRASVAAVRAPARVIPPGVVIPADPPPLPPDDGRLLVGTTGRLAPIKGLVHLVRALPSVLRSAGDVMLDIIGEGPTEAELRAEAVRLGIENRVRFPGWQADTRPALKRLHLYVQPSLYEGFGIATLEAMASARPVVATAVGGTLELVSPASGVLVPPADCAALADAIASLLADPERRRTLACAAWQRAKSFSEERMVRDMAALYEELLEGARAS
jgi:glycosyltransferase involved in cell wall biosynthesis